MVRVAISAAIAILAGVALTFSRPPSAVACTVTPEADPLYGADLVLEGRVLAWDGHLLHLLVHRAYSGPASLITVVESVATSCSLQGFVETNDYVVIAVTVSRGTLFGDWPGLAFASPSTDDSRLAEVQYELDRRFGQGAPPTIAWPWWRGFSAW